MKLYVLDLGKIVMRGDNPVVDTAQANAEAPAIPIHAFLADTPVGKILFDTGCHPKAMEGAWPPEMCTNPYVAGSEAGPSRADRCPSGRYLHCCGIPSASGPQRRAPSLPSGEGLRTAVGAGACAARR